MRVPWVFRYTADAGGPGEYPGYSGRGEGQVGAAVQLLCLLTGRKTEMILLRRSVMMVLVMLVLPSFCLAGWVGPKEVVKGKWGNKPGEFGRESVDLWETFPTNYCLTSSGNIIIADELNARIEVFNNDGTLHSVFGPKMISSDDWKSQWPLTMGCFSNSIYTGFGRYRQVYNLEGGLIYNWVNIFGNFVGVTSNDSFITFVPIDKTYNKYSFEANLITTFTSKPIELGAINNQVKNMDGTYLSTIEYDDYIYKIPTEKIIQDYSRDSFGNIYVMLRIKNNSVFNYKVYKFGLCGELTSQIDLLTDQIIKESDPEDESIPPSPVPNITIVAKYGKPLIAANGDIYAWKFSETKYSILKWTWQDDPNTPSCPDSKIKQAACDNTGFMKTDMRLAAADLAGKSKEDLRLMRNEIYARHGKTFQSADLQKYFSGKCWYKADSGYSDSLLTPVDRENIRIVQDAEKGM